MRSWRSNAFYVLICAVILTELQLMTIVRAQGGGGMVPLSEVIDHPVGEDNKQSSHKTSSSQSSEQDYRQGQPLSQKKKDIHIKIARSHMQEKQEASDDPSSLDGDKFFRKDKSPDLQDSLRHASDEWLLKFLIQQYRVSDTVEEKLEILQNLENFSHKFENGRDLFKSTTAVKDILIPALNSTQVEIRKSACAVFAVAAQNNGVVQRIANDAGAIRNLVHLLAFDPPLRAKALFALSSLLRNFPEAQAKFIHEGGIPALIKVAFSFETRKRCLSLVTDLLTERKYCLLEQEIRKKSTSNEDFHFDTSTPSPTKSSGDHIDHYDNVEDPCDEFKLLEKALKDSGWCDVLADSVKSLGGFDTEDQLITVGAVASSLSFCRNEIAPHSRFIQGLLIKFQDDEDFQEESLTLKSVIDTITSDEPGLNRDEL